MKIEWRPEALASAHRFIRDQPGLRAVNEAVNALASGRVPADAFVRGEYRRLTVGRYRVRCAVSGDTVTVLRVDERPEPQ